MRLGRNRGNDPAKERKLSTGVNRAAQSGAVIFTLCFGATSAFAADLPAPAPIPPPAYLPPVYNWTGFYIGGNIGAGWSGLSDTNTNFSDTLGSTFSAATNVQFLGGGQVGVNYEFANGIVIGAEAMFDWLANSQNATVTATDPSGAFAANIGTSNARWLTTAIDRPGASPGVPKALKRTAAAAEQFQIIPTMPSGALSPVFSLGIRSVRDGFGSKGKAGHGFCR